MSDATALPTIALDQLAIREIIADVDRVTRGRRRVDIAHALLDMIGTEIASNAESPAAAKHHGQLVAKQLKAAVREKFFTRPRRPGGALGPD